MRNYDCLRETPAYRRDIYSELKRIEERGKRKKKQQNHIIILIRNLVAPRAARC